MKYITAGESWECESEDGCTVMIDQQENHWSMSFNCGTGPQYYSGWGEYSGTACNGAIPEIN
ncbi:hypothetical protein [Rhodohalobacter sp.]|uniref:hypothetical protein n=1 Tax=Rhodohalobacter sp. TaxID=1974210 RepID=UPI003564301C